MSFIQREKELAASPRSKDSTHYYYQHRRAVFSLHQTMIIHIAYRIRHFPYAVLRRDAELV